jgi:hypothetical protein
VRRLSRHWPLLAESFSVAFLALALDARRQNYDRPANNGHRRGNSNEDIMVAVTASSLPLTSGKHARPIRRLA